MWPELRAATKSPMRRSCSALRRGLFLFALACMALPVATPCRAQTARLGSEFRVNSYTTSYQERPKVSRNGVGGFVVVWQTYLQDGSLEGIAARRYDGFGSALGLNFVVNAYTTGNQTRPSVAIGSTGDFVVVWNSYGQDGQYGGIFGQRFTNAGSPTGSQFFVNTYTSGDQGSPSVTKDGNGNFIVVWESGAGPLALCCYQDGDGAGIYGQRYSSVGVAQGAEFRVNTYTRDYQTYPSVATDSTGNFVVAWETYGQDRSDYGIWGQRYTNTGTQSGQDFQVNSFTPFGQTSPAVARNASGSFVITWQSYGQDGSGYGVYGQRYTSAGALSGSEFGVNTATTSDQNRPAVAMDTAGDFVVVWQSFLQDGSGSGIFGQRYNSNGTPKGIEFRVNTHTSGSQRYPSVSMDSSGNFVAVWESVGQDGWGTGVYGQRFQWADCPALSSSGPSNVTACTGGTAFLTVTPSGIGPFAYQWRMAGANLADGTRIIGSKSAKLKLKQVSAADQGSYDCVLTDYCLPPANATTAAATLTVTANQAPGAVTGLTLQRVNGGTSLKFTWSNTTNAVDYALFADTTSGGSFASQIGTSTSGTTGLTIPMPSGNRFYLVAGRNGACGVGPQD